MTYRSSSALTGATAANAAVPVPAGAAIGDIAVVGLYMESAAAVTPPAGFTLKSSLQTSVATRGRLDVFWKRLTAADSGTYSFTHASTFRAAACVLHSGRVATGDPFDGTVGTAESTTTVATLNVSTSPTNANGDAVGFWTNFNGGTTFSAPASYTQQQSVSSVICLETRDTVAAGSTGNVTATSTISDFEKAFLGVLAPAAGGNNTAVTPAAETDTAVTPARARAAATTPAAETDTALTPTAARSRATTPAAETDQALTPTTARTAAVTPASESDAAVTPGHARTITPATETDTAVTPSQPGGTPITPATETDTALTPSRSRATLITPASESDVGVTPAALRSTPTTPAAEVDAGVTPTRARARSVTPAAESDTAVTPGQARAQLIVPALEVDQAVDVQNPNELLRDLDLKAIIEPGRFAGTVEQARFTSTVEPGRFRTEIEA